MEFYSDGLETFPPTGFILESCWKILLTVYF